MAEQLQWRAEEVGSERFRSARWEHKSLMLEATELFQQGLPESEPRVRQLSERARALWEVITGGDNRLGAQLLRLNKEGYLRQGWVGPGRVSLFRSGPSIARSWAGSLGD